MADETVVANGGTDAADSSSAAPVSTLLTDVPKAAADPAAGGAPAEVKAEGKQEPSEVQTDDKAAKQGEKPGPPEKYEFTAPEGVALDPAALEAFEPVARELGLSQEQAQKLVDIEVTRMKAQTEAWQKRVEAWVDDVKADPEIGGQKFADSLRDAQRIIAKFGNPELKQTLNETGLGNHPEVIRLFARLGREMGEDKIVTGQHGATRDAARILFPNLN